MKEKAGCIFCKLGKDNPNKLFDDETCYVILDKYPSDYGHMLVISKDHHENVLTSEDSTVSHMFLVAKRFGKMACEKFGASGLVISTNTGRDGGQLIFHFHVHVIPKYADKLKGFMPHREITDEEARILKEKLNS